MGGVTQQAAVQEGAMQEGMAEERGMTPTKRMLEANARTLNALHPQP